MLKGFFNKFSSDIGLDLGTSNTRVCLGDKGVVINEPSVVAVNNKTDRMVAYGTEARNMFGKTPAHLRSVHPIVGGVISDYEVAEEFLASIIGRANNIESKLLAPRIVVGVPVGITNVETRAVYDAVKASGAREVYIIEEPMAAAIGSGLDVHNSSGVMIIDIGAGTTDIAVISLSGIILSESLKIGGKQMDIDIINYLKNNYKIIIGEKTAEEIKIQIGSIMPEGDDVELKVKGRDAITGLPKEVTINDTDVRKAMYPSVLQILDTVKTLVEKIPPEVVSDLMLNGVLLSGGGSLIRGLPDFFQQNIKLPISLSINPLTAVSEGAARVLEDLVRFEEVLIKDHEEIAYR